jgi:hypothetical protein
MVLCVRTFSREAPLNQFSGKEPNRGSPTSVPVLMVEGKVFHDPV